METVLALIVALAVFVPCAAYGASVLRSDKKERPEMEPACDGAGDESREDPRVDVNVTVVRKVTTLALTSIKQVFIGDRRRPELPAGPAGQPDDTRDDPPAGGGGSSPEWDDYDLDDLEDVLGGVDDPNTAEAPRPPLWEDAEVIRPHKPPKPAADALPEPERPDRGQLPPVGHRPVESAEPAEFAPLPAGSDGAVDAEPVRTRIPSSAPALTGARLDVDQAPVILEGVDMSQAPIVPASDGSAARLPSIQQMQTALATGGFERLLSWLRAFKRASNNTLSQAQNVHSDAMAIARRTRTKYALALQAFQAVQADRLDRRTIANVFTMLEQAHREAAAAAAATTATAALVVAAGGSPPAVAATIRTLKRNHGAIAAAVKGSPEPVRNITWYQQ